MKSKSLPNFRHGQSILIKPENLDLNYLENLKVKEPKVYLKYSNFYDKDFSKEDNLVNYITKVNSKPIVIKLEENKKSKQNLTLDFSKDPFQTLLIKLNKNSNLNLILFLVNGKSISSLDIRVISEEKSNLELKTIQNLSKDSIHFQTKKIQNKKNSKSDIIDLLIGSSYLRLENYSYLEESSKTSQKNFFISSNSQKFDIYNFANHKEKNSSSNLLTKGVCKDKSNTLARGLIRIEKDATNSKGFEKQEIFKISKEAFANAIPSLEVKCQKVSCSHETSIGKLNEKEIFYLKSRGISRKKAINLIIKGYFTDLFNILDNTKIKKEIIKLI